MNLLDQIRVTPLQQIFNPGGDVWHALKSTEESFQGFGEAYFSWVELNSIKAWKQHPEGVLSPLGASTTAREPIWGF